MSGYALHPDAFADLDEIWEYIAQANIDAADRVLADIHTVLVLFVRIMRSPVLAASAILRCEEVARGRRKRDGAVRCVCRPEGEESDPIRKWRAGGSSSKRERTTGSAHGRTGGRRFYD
jgi:plasmid stabilization system protein ParE